MVETPFVPIPTQGMETSKTEGYKKPTRIYEDANDQHVRKYVIYTDNTYAYVDAAKSEKLTADTLIRWALLGAVVQTSTGYEFISSVTKTGESATLKAGSLTLHSAEYSAAG